MLRAHHFPVVRTIDEARTRGLCRVEDIEKGATPGQFEESLPVPGIIRCYRKCPYA